LTSRRLRFSILLSALLLAFNVDADETLRVGDSKGLYHALLSAAGELGGLDYPVQFAEFPATAPALEALAAGAIDLRGSAAAPLVFALAAGAHVKAVAALHQEGQRESVAILVPPGSAIHGVADLRGKRIGTNKGSVGHHLVLAALQRDGIPVSAVEIRYLLPADAKAALSAGAVDAWSTWEPYVSIAEVEDRDRAVVDGTGLPIPDSAWVASDIALIQKRAHLIDLVARLGRAQQWAHGHLDEYARLYASQTGLALEVARRIAAHMDALFTPINDGVIREYQGVADLYRDAGVIRQAVDVSAAFDGTVWRPSVAPVQRTSARQ
jgi:sulfonate transport system substrate-binding protein